MDVGTTVTRRGGRTETPARRSGRRAARLLGVRDVRPELVERDAHDPGHRRDRRERRRGHAAGLDLAQRLGRDAGGEGRVEDRAGAARLPQQGAEPLAADVSNTGRPGRSYRLRPGLLLALEPWVMADTDRLVMDPDGWTLRSATGCRTAHTEHTIAITETGAEILTRPSRA